jgi:hypothetical protein
MQIHSLPSPTAKRAACNSQTNNNGLKPTQMGFYHGAWADIVEHSKCLYHLTLHMSPSAFPEHNQAGLSEAHNCLFEAIAHYEEMEGCQFNHGSFFLCLACYES